MKITQISEILCSLNSVRIDLEINWLLTDSRNLSFPSETLYFAIKSNRNNGHNYIIELYNQNVRNFVISEFREEFNDLWDANFIVVEDTVVALQKLVTEHRKQFNIPIIGITGSNGKTVIKEWLYQLLHQDYKISRSPRSYNSQIGVPLSVWNLKQDTDMGIFEAGISLPNEMERLERIISPTIGILSNIGDAHQENFSSLKQKCDEKLRLFINSELLIYCSDNKLIDISVSQSNFQGKKLDWGNNDKALIKIKSIRKGKSSTDIEIEYELKKHSFQIQFIDDASIENILHCIALMLYLNYDTNTISERLINIEPVAMRMNVKEGINHCIIINDTYNSDLNSLSIALDFLNQQAVSKTLDRTLIISDMYQTGQSNEELFIKISELINNKKINKLIGIGTEILRCKDSFNVGKMNFFVDTDDFLRSGLLRDFNHEVILIKGSRSFQLERISAQLEFISHETILEVNLNALIDNLNYFRSKLKPETKVVCMVKAFAYGSGAVEVSRTLQHHRCDYLAVAVADEGAELRREGIKIPIMVMNPELGGFGMIIDNNLEPEIYNFRILEAFCAEVGKLGLTDYPIHIKIDSGMHRLGFEPSEINNLIEYVKANPQIKIRTVFSHLSAADDARYDSFTRQQVDTFLQCADLITSSFSHDILKHICNSAATERFPEYQFDMIRLGIGHYGISSIPDLKLKTVCALKTIIIQIKDIPAGESIGYGRKGISSKNRKIGILPIGYADGYDRKLGNGVGEVFVNGKRAKIVGNICMDLCMIDITGMDVTEGDVVELFGENISIIEIAEQLKTITYEVLTGISRRVKRIYYQE
jgi:alanine racemase